MSIDMETWGRLHRGCTLDPATQTVVAIESFSQPKSKRDNCRSKESNEHDFICLGRLAVGLDVADEASQGTRSRSPRV